MKYIEKDFPLEELSQIAKKEGTPALKHPLHGIHKWWARRPNSVFRMIILTTFLEGSLESHELWETFYRATFLDKTLGTSPIILDPFMGGGTTIVEGLQLNTRVIGVDINPVAWFVTKKTIDSLCFELLAPELDQLEKRIEFMKAYYLTHCPLCGGKADVMYFFWVKKVKCVNCKNLVPLHPNFRITTRRGKVNIVFCPQCGHIFNIKTSDSAPVSCKNCHYTFIPSKGYVTGRGYFICPFCQNRNAVLRAAQLQGKIPELEMYAIEYYCPTDERHYKKPDSMDQAVFEKAVSSFEEKRDQLPYPRQKIPDGFNYQQAKNYGYEYFYQMFNKRQLLILSTLLEGILAIHDQNTREFMLLAFSDSLQYNNMFTRYHRSNAKVESMFAKHAYWPPTTTVENNTWGILGKNKTPQAGSFRRSIQKLRDGKQFCLNPYRLHVTYEGKTHKIQLSNSTVEGYIVHTFQELKKHEHSVLLKCQTSENLHFIPDKSIDAVITDPPYFDNIMYSEVSDFFYVWLRIGLRDNPIFQPLLTPRAREIIVNPALNGKQDSRFFLEGLTNVFREAHRVLKENGLFTFTFHHKNTVAWSVVLLSLLNSGFTIISVYPIQSEMGSSLHIRDKQACHFDTIITAKKRDTPKQTITWDQLEEQISLRAKQLLTRIRKAHKNLTGADLSSIVLGKCLELYSHHHPNVYHKQKQMEISSVITKMMTLIETLSSTA
ncbi:MAG: DUF1156 domain-containing protein [Candidatus Heimdallarchaeota archaeon]